jgi:hypothetical protein
MVAASEVDVEVPLVNEKICMILGVATGVALFAYLVAFMVAMMWITLKFVGAE